MKNMHDSSGDATPLHDAGKTAQAISLDRAEEIAGEVHDLIKAGNVPTAWERLRYLHPADIGSIVAGLPRTSRDAMVQTMSPETVTWILRQMNPVEAGRVGARLGSRILSRVLRQVHPQQALKTLHRLPILRAHEVARELEQPHVAEDILEREPNTAGALMVSQFPAVGVGGRVKELRDSISAMGEERLKFTHAFLLQGDGGLAGQVSMVDLAVAENATPIETIATSTVATVTRDTPATECARLQRHYNLSQLPVIE